MAVIVAICLACAALVGAGHSQWNLFTASPFSSIVLVPFRGTILITILGNLPQVLLAWLYIFINNLWTTMHLAAEYAGYAVIAKGLRVSAPQGRQRSTYWLNLPFRYSVPLAALSAILHWAVAQTLFVVDATLLPVGMAPGQAPRTAYETPTPVQTLGMPFISRLLPKPSTGLTSQTRLEHSRTCHQRYHWRRAYPCPTRPGPAQTPARRAHHFHK